MNVTIALGASALLGVGVAETVSPGVSLSGEMRGQNLSFALELRGVPPGKVYARVPVDPSQPYSTVEMDFSEWTGLLVPCFRYSYFVGCGVAQGGANVLKSKRSEQRYAVLNFGPRVGFEVPFGERFALTGHAELLVRATIPENNFVYGLNGIPPANTHWEATPVTGFLSVGLIVKLN